MGIIIDDLQRIVVDTREQFSNRRVLTVTLTVVACLVVIIVGLAAALGVTSHAVLRWNWLYGGDRCSTPECLRTAAWIAESLDIDGAGQANTSAALVDPCEDFYRFACGKWETRHVIPPDQSEVSLLDMLYDEIDNRLHVLIDRGPSPRSRSTAPGTPASAATGGLPPSMTKLQQFYRSCMHDYNRMANAGRELVGMITQYARSWYVLDPNGWHNGWDFNEVFKDVRAQANFFYSTWFTKDRINGGHIILMKFTGLGLPSYIHYLNEDRIGVQEAYKDYMRTLAGYLLRDANITITPTESRERIDQFVDDVYGQEDRLARILRQAAEERLLYVQVRTTVGQMDREYTQLHWHDSLARVFDAESLPDDQPIILQGPRVFQLVNEMLLNESNSDNRDRIMNNYMVWRLVTNYANELSNDYREAGARFNNVVFGTAEIPSTWRICVNTAKTRLGSLLAWMYIKAHLVPEVKLQVSTLYNNIRSGLIQRLKELQWMDSVTLSRAIEKVESIDPVIGFGERYYNDSLMEQIHSTLDIRETNSYLQNLLAINAFQRRQRIRLFFLESEPNWSQHLPLIGWSDLWEVRPFYDWFTNSLVIPAGGLSDPSFETTRPQVFNYGVLGSEIATTMVYSISEIGRNVWINGSYGPWWTNATFVEYGKTKDCFSQYFSGLNVGPLLINGINTSIAVNARRSLWRIMSDIGGIRAGLRAYNELTRATSDRLPVGLNMNSQQLYFISIAQTKCYLRTDEATYRMALSNILPEDVELNSLLAHMSEFTDAFKCPPGSKLEATYQCNVY